MSCASFSFLNGLDMGHRQMIKYRGVKFSCYAETLSMFIYSFYLLVFPARPLNTVLHILASWRIFCWKCRRPHILNLYWTAFLGEFGVYIYMAHSITRILISSSSIHNCHYQLCASQFHLWCTRLWSSSRTNSQHLKHAFFNIQLKWSSYASGKHLTFTYI